MRTKLSIAVVALIAAGSLSSAASAQILYQDQMNDGAGWGVNASANGDNAYTFNYE